MNVSRIRHSLIQTMYRRSRHTMAADVVIANSPDSVVASPYEGRKNGSMVMMKMPNPNPVVRCTKLAPMQSKKMASVIAIVVDQSLSE